MLNWNNFHGGVLSDPQLPISVTDFYLVDEKDEILVLLDGFIYNKDEIIRELSFTNFSIGSPQVILFAYRQWGESFIRKLNGDFAICIYEKKLKKAIFFRDHLGIRPVAICNMESVIYFSTDIIGLCKALFSSTKIDRYYLLNLFLDGGSKYEILPSRHVEKVLPGHYACIENGKMIQTRYWTPSVIIEDKKLDFSKIKSDLEILLNDAVRIRCNDKFFASAHVSGGLDSGLVAAISRREYKNQREFYGFSWTPENKDDLISIPGDESPFVNAICQMYSIIPIHSNFNADDFIDFVSNWRYFSEMVYEKKIIESAKNKGVNLIFSGWGGDEFISTSDRGIDVDLIKGLNWRIFLKKYPLTRPKRLIWALIFNVFFPSAKRQYFKYKAEPDVYRYIKSLLENNIILRRERNSYSSRRRSHLQFIGMNHIAARCEDWYVSGQRNGAEYRYPLLDRRIVEYMLRVPSKCLVDGNNNRIIMRDIAKKYLPEIVVLNKSKSDPLKSYFLGKAVKEVTDRLINEVENFKENEDLTFVDFQLLEETINKYKNGNNEENPVPVLFCIKRAHEFTKGYYS